MDSATPTFFTGVDAELLKTFAAQAGIAIRNARLYEDLQHQMEELRRAQAQLVQSAKMAAVGELAAGVAHELNNPLTSVLGFAELLTVEADLDAAALEDLGVIAQEARRARTIVRDLLDFARQAEPVYGNHDPNRLLQATLGLLRQRIANSQVHLVERYAPDLPHLRIDANRLKQVFLNLITNALDAMPRGGTLTVGTALEEEHVAVRIADTGSGIPEEHLPRIFDPFFTTKPVGRGTGLGLSVSQGIVQAQGGFITVESQEGVGSTFTVRLPLRSEASRP